MRLDVATFGSSVVDVFVDTDIAEKNNFMYYPVGSKILLKNLRFDVGGGGINTAVSFSRLGLKTGYIGKIGDDTDGESIFEVLKKEKINFLGKIQKGAISGYSIILDSKEHDRTILTYKGVNDELDLKEIKFKSLEVNWLYYSSMLRKSFETQKKLAKIFTQKGAKLAFNPSEYLIKNCNLAPILKLTEVLVLNKEEAQLLTKEKDLLNSLHKLGPKIIVVTDRDKPAFCSDGKRTYSIVPHKDIKVVERTGAGDAFASGFVAGLIKTQDIEKSLQIGVANSESVVKYFGSTNKILTWKEALRAINKNPCKIIRSSL